MIELAWAAGLFDGEGSCTRFTSKGKRYRQLKVSQKLREPLARFMAAVGNRGSIYVCCDTTLQWSCQGQEAQEVYDLLEPYLCSIKKNQWITALTREAEPDRIRMG